MDPYKNTEEFLKAELKKRILFMDGAMGTMIQQHQFVEADYRGERFKSFAAPEGERELFLKGIMSSSVLPSLLSSKKSMRIT